MTPSPAEPARNRGIVSSINVAAGCESCCCMRFAQGCQQHHSIIMGACAPPLTGRAFCRVDVLVKRFKDNMHVGMSTPTPSLRDCQLALSLIRAQWEHARTADDQHPFNLMGDNALKNLSSSKNGESSAKL